MRSFRPFVLSGFRVRAPLASLDSRKSRMKVCSTVLGFVLVAAVVVAAEKPNVVLIFADDLGINELSCYGRKDQATPNLDRMAAEGMRFTCGYCSQPICSPSRAGLMTGKTPG